MAKETIPVTVILTHYRRPYTIIKALLSLAAQTVKPAEVIIIDDHSPFHEFQNLEAALKKVYRTPFNMGLGLTRNMAIDLATQPFIALMDDDDTWHREKLELQYKAFYGKGDDSINAFSFTWAMNGRTVKKFPVYRWEWIFDDLYLGQRINHVPAPTMMINRDLLAQCGGWGRTRHSEDLSTALRLSVLGRVYCVDKPLIYSDPNTPSLSRSRHSLLAVFDYLRALTEGARFAVKCRHKLPVPLWVRYRQVLSNWTKGQLIKLKGR